MMRADSKEDDVPPSFQPPPRLAFSDDGSTLQPVKPAPRSVPISHWNKLTYVAPFFVVACAEIFYQTYQTKFYVSDMKMRPNHYALFNAIVRSADLFTFPFLGWLTDNTFVNSWLLPRGRRRPFIAIGAPLVALSLYLLFSPPDDAPAHAIAVWYTVFASMYHVVPLTMSYSSLAVELTSDYDEQASVFGWSNVSASLGRLAGALGPGVLVVAVTADHRRIFPMFSAVLGTLILVLYWHLVAAVKVPRGPFEPSARGRDGALWEQPMFILPTGSSDEALSVWQCAVRRPATTQETQSHPAVPPSNPVPAHPTAVPPGVFDAASRQLRAQWLDGRHQHDWDVELLHASSKVTPLHPPDHHHHHHHHHHHVDDDAIADPPHAPGVLQPPPPPPHHPDTPHPTSAIVSPFNLPISPLPIAPGIIWASRNPALVTLVFTESLLGVTRSMTNALAAFYVQFVLQPTQAYELWLGIGFASFLLFAAFGTVVWKAVSYRYDQRTAFLGGVLFSLAPGLGMMALGAGDIYWYCALQATVGFTFGGSQWLLGALRASAIDYDHLYLGMRREAQYLTYINVPVHWVDIPLTALAFGLLETSGFNPDADDQSDSTQRTLRLLYVLIPSTCTLLAWIVAFNYPITRAVHAQLFPSASSADPGPPPPSPPGSRSSSPSPSSPSPSPPPFTSLETPRDQVVQLGQHGGVAMIDPLSKRPILPPRYYRAASLDWLLDHFGTGTVARLVAQRRREARDGVATHDLEFRTVDGGDRGGGGGDPSAPSVAATAVPQNPAAVSVPSTPAMSRLLGTIPMSLFHKELALALLWGANAAAAVFCVMLGLLGDRPGVAIAGMLWTGLSGLCVIFFAVRVDAARQMDTVPLAALERYLRVWGVDADAEVGSTGGDKKDD